MVRQISLGRELASRGVDVVLVGSLGGARWVSEMLRGESAITWASIAEGTFDASELSSARGKVVVVDSYLFGKAQSEQLEGLGIQIVQFWDGPWQAMVGQTVIAPVLDFSFTLGEISQGRVPQILGGPEFVIIRPEIKEVRQRRAATNISSIFRIVVLFGGGSDQTHIGWVVKAIQRVNFPCEVDIFSASPDEQLSFSTERGPQIRFHSAGPQLLPFLERASLAISAVGTTAVELIYLAIPSIFIPVVENQSENSRNISALQLGKVVSPDDPDREDQMVEEILRQIRLFRFGPTGLSGRRSQCPLIDGEGARRVADAIVSLGSSQ